MACEEIEKSEPGSDGGEAGRASMSEVGPYHVSVEAIANLCRVTPRRVQQLVAEGIIQRPEQRGKYPLATSIRAFTKYQQDQIAASRSSAPDETRAKARLLSARADLAEMEAAREREQLVSAQNVEAAWVAILALLRTRLLSVPDRVAPVAHGQETVSSARDIIRAAIREALDDLAQSDTQSEPDPDGAEGDPGHGDESSVSTAPAGGSDGERLG